ncbi:hypothetical protein BVG16_00185 [Paenibacillus selenitireducens]|uniref:ABC transporter ATP-binding protein n=1 Tax=Paenibacillus selenitireducens TaxID=1324314 RepID=A0A1T2XLW8_9BACL|nr:ABC transporter ATP-binding protein [Paenibacillus selenitireducens]OPA80812.1 hypothetical protein BVG16_00185 [Paenibacillus selenitireducens]
MIRLNVQGVFKRLSKYMLNYKLLYTGLLLSMFVGIVMDLFIAWFLSFVSNAAVHAQVGQWKNIIVLGIVMLVVLFVNSYCDTLLKNKISVNIRNDLRMDTMKHVMRLPQSYFDRNHSGDLLSRFTNDNQSVGDACGGTIMGLIRNPLLALAAFTYLLYIHWLLAIICFAMGPLIFLIGKVFGKAMRINSVQHQQKMGVATSFLNDILGSSAIFKTFKLEQRLLKRYQQHSEEISALEQTKGKIEGATNATSQVAANLTFLMAIVIAGYYVSQGDLEIGAMLAFIQLMNYLVSPFSALPGLIASLQQSLGGAERIFELMDQKTEYEDLPEDLNQKQHFEQLQLDAVSLSYSEEDPKPVLQDIHLQVKSGEMLAIVGPSGGGKSTLFKGLLGFYPFTQGSMRINDVDVEEMTLSKLRDYFAFVPQETHLYTGTIRDNLLSGDHLADDAAIHTALRRANAYEFVMELPQGLDTDIGEHGSRLSGGQRQRLSIARAILKDSPILLLDEATAALDNESEKIVQDALRRLMSEKTTLVIAHRLSTIQKADTIVVMDNGRIVERGTHEELLAGKGRYHALYYSQVERDEVTA